MKLGWHPSFSEQRNRTKGKKMSSSRPSGGSYEKLSSRKSQDVESSGDGSKGSHPSSPTSLLNNISAMSVAALVAIGVLTVLVIAILVMSVVIISHTSNSEAGMSLESLIARQDNFDAQSPVQECSGTTQRSFDGTCTTLLLRKTGSTQAATLETITPGTFIDYGKGPNERALSNLFFKGPEEIPNTLGVNLWFSFFIEIEDIFTHDFVQETLSGATQAQLIATGNPFSVLDYVGLKMINTVPGGFVDPTDVFSPLINPGIQLPYLLQLDSYHPSSDVCVKKRCFCTKSAHTPWIDMDGVIYPNNPSDVNASRTLVGGQLKTKLLASGEAIAPTWNQTGRPFPFNGIGIFQPFPDPQTGIDVSGTPGGASLNVITTTALFYREHNRLAAWLQTQNPTWTDEQLFQRARAWNIAQYQSIWVYEWLKVALGPLYEQLFGSTYPGYDFSATSIDIPSALDGAFRSIHSTLYEDLDVVLPGPVTALSLPAIIAIANSSGQIDLLNTVFGGSTAPIVRGWLVEPCNELDSIYVEFLRTLLPPGSPAPALDLGASDIRRSRLDHVVNYVDSRKFWRNDDLYTKPGCVAASPIDPLACFLAITSNVTVAATLQAVYKKVNAVDLHVGAMVEDRHPGTIVPHTYAYIIGNTLQKIRKGDGFWFETTHPQFRQFNNTEIAQIRATRLIDIINRNTPLTCPLAPGVNSFMTQPTYAC